VPPATFGILMGDLFHGAQISTWAQPGGVYGGTYGCQNGCHEYLFSAGSCGFLCWELSGMGHRGANSKSVQIRTSARFPNIMMYVSRLVLYQVHYFCIHHVENKYSITPFMSRSLQVSVFTAAFLTNQISSEKDLM
jgi:hypothetical protein